MTEELEQALATLATDRHDEDAWTVIYRRLRPSVYSLAFRKLGGRSDEAKDATQEVFIRLVKYCRFERFEDLASFRSYLYVVTRHTTLQLLERQVGTSAEGKEISLDSLAEPDAMADDASPVDESMLIQDLLRSALAEVSELDRTALSLRLAGYSIREIAERVDSSPGAMRVRLHRVRKKLRAYRLLRDLV